MLPTLPSSLCVKRKRMMNCSCLDELVCRGRGGSIETIVYVDAALLSRCRTQKSYCMFSSVTVIHCHQRSSDAYKNSKTLSLRCTIAATLVNSLIRDGTCETVTRKQKKGKHLLF